VNLKPGNHILFQDTTMAFVCRTWGKPG